MYRRFAIYICRGCTESNCTGVIFICFHQFILPIMLHMTKYDLETLIEYIFSYFLVRLLNPCWSAFLILAFKWSNILMIGFTSNSFAHFWIFLKIRPQKWSDTLFSCKIWCSFRILGWFEPTSTVKGFKLGKTTFFTVFNFFFTKSRKWQFDGKYVSINFSGTRRLTDIYNISF